MENAFGNKCLCNKKFEGLEYKFSNDNLSINKQHLVNAERSAKYFFKLYCPGIPI
jgi:hypothetical protein